MILLTHFRCGCNPGKWQWAMQHKGEDKHFYRCVSCQLVHDRRTEPSQQSAISEEFWNSFKEVHSLKSARVE